MASDLFNPGDFSSAESADAAASPEAAPTKPVRKRAPRRATSATAKAAAPAEPIEPAAPADSGDATDGSSDAEPAEAPAAPVKRVRKKAATKRTTAKKAAVAADAVAATGDDADADAASRAALKAEATPVGLLDLPLEQAIADEASELDEDGELVDAETSDSDDSAAESAEPAAVASVPSFSVLFQAPEPAVVPRRRRAASAPAGPAAPKADDDTDEATEALESGAPHTDDHVDQGAEGSDQSSADTDGDEAQDGTNRRRRSRGGRGRRSTNRSGDAGDTAAESEDASDDTSSDHDGDSDGDADGDDSATSRRRRRRRRAGSGSSDSDDSPGVQTRVREPRRSEEATAVRGSTRLEAKKQRRREGREAGRRRTIITEAEFLARREAVERVMVVRVKDGRTQMGVLEDEVLVEHYIDRETNVSMAGNIYLGRVQNVLPSMEAAFVDIGKGRNAVLYAGEVNWDAAGLDSNQPKRIENALESGQTVLVQVTKDPIGHKGARLTSQVSLPGRYLVYVPNSSMTGISRKLPDNERLRLKRILRDVVPDTAGVIVRTAAEGASEEELRAYVERLTSTWEKIQAKVEELSTPKAGKSKGRKRTSKAAKTAAPAPSGAPVLLHGEPDLTVRVIRDVFNEDFTKLVIAGDQAWNEIHDYVTSVAPDLADRLERWTGEKDLFTHYRVDEQISKAMDRKVWLPSGGSLVIDRTEAMTVVDVNTGKFVGSGGNLEETVTKNNIEAAEEIVRQLRLRDIGGIIVIDFIDMVLEVNRDLVVRRLLECLGRDRTKHQVAEVTSLGLVQMTRKRVGSGLIEVFSETCGHCNGRGFIIHTDPVDAGHGNHSGNHSGNQSGNGGNGSSGSNGGGEQSNSRGRRRGGSSASTGTNAGDAAAKANGPSAAQIAAAAHAAAIKGLENTPIASGIEEPDESQDAPIEHEAPAAEVVQAEVVQAEVVVADFVPDEVVPAAESNEPAAATVPSEDLATTHEPAGSPHTEVVAPADEAPAAAPRRRRKSGRVVAPAGPPKPIESSDA